MTEHELRQDARQQQADLERVQQREAEEADRRKSELERQVVGVGVGGWVQVCRR